jgi:hypothetical protein
MTDTFPKPLEINGFTFITDPGKFVDLILSAGVGSCDRQNPLP